MPMRMAAAMGIPLDTAQYHVSMPHRDRIPPLAICMKRDVAKIRE